jgi:hypothetical protein
MRAARPPGPAGGSALLPVIAAVAGVALAGCATTVAVTGASTARHLAAPAPATTIVCAHAGQVNRLTVTRVNQFPRNNVHFTFPAHLTITSAPRAQAAVKALCALPPFPHTPLPMSCPADLGINYLLSFTSADRRFHVVTVDPGGCEQVEGLDWPGWAHTRWAARSPAFWHLLGVAAGIVHPGYPAFSGSIAFR